jgi:flavin reductase ActVB
MSRFPTGVTVVVTRDRAGRPRGFTASSFASLSDAPPRVLVCLARSAACCPAFLEAPRFAVHVLSADQQEAARRFATRGTDKFAGGETGDHPDGLPVLKGVVARLSCTARPPHDGGDHVVLVGEVAHTEVWDLPPAVYVRRGFRRLCEPEP